LMNPGQKKLKVVVIGIGFPAAWSNHYLVELGR